MNSDRMQETLTNARARLRASHNRLIRSHVALARTVALATTAKRALRAEHGHGVLLRATSSVDRPPS